MSLINLIKTSIYSLKSHKLRAFLTMIGIIIGISSVVTILSIGNGLKQQILNSSKDTNANKINIYFTPENSDIDKSLIEPFTKSDIYKIHNIKGVQKVEKSEDFISGISFFSSIGTYFDKKTTIMLDTYGNKTLDIEYGTGFSADQEDKKLIVLDQKVAKTLFDNPQKSIGKGIEINGDNYEVIGVLKDNEGFSANSGYSYISNKSIESMSKEDTISSIDVYVDIGEDKEKIFEEINQELTLIHPNLQGKYELQDPQEITKAFETIIGGVTTFITFVTGISLFVGGIGVMNIMYVSVSERKREIGIRRAIGAKPRNILMQFLFEAIIVTSTGGLIGILCGYITANLVGIFMPFKPILSVDSFVGATLTSIMIGIIFGIIPASNAAELDPIKAIYN